MGTRRAAYGTTVCGVPGESNGAFMPRQTEKLWAELDDEARTHATTLGYDASIWDGEV